MELLESRQLLSTAVSLVGTSGNDNFAVNFDSDSLMYSFSGGSTSPAAVAASDLSSFSIAGGGGSDTLTINGGSPTLLNDAGSDGTNLSVEITTGSTLNFASIEHLTALNVDSGAVATMLNNGSRILVANTLSIAGSTNGWTGQLDLTNNSLIVHNGDLPTLNNQTKSGFANGNWNGEGIISSAAANSSTSLTALGTIQNSANGSPSGTVLYSTFGSQTGCVDTDVLVKYTFYGDANLTGHVDGSDYSRIDSAFVAGGSGWYNGDFNYDGSINGSDYTLIDNAFNTQPGSATPTTLPDEPTGLTILQSITGEVDMQWNPSPDTGVITYNVYTGTDPTFVPSAADQVATGISENAYSDYFDSDPSITWYYKITAVNSSGVESGASATTGASMPATIPDGYSDSPDLAPDANADNGDIVVQPAQKSRPLATPATPINNLIAFYGSGGSGYFGNMQFGNEPNDGVASPSLVSAIGGNQKSDGMPYSDFGMNQALTDLMAELDTNGDKTISAGEIAAENIRVLGYSWGAVEATNFTRMLATANPHLLGFQTNNGSPKNPHLVYIGGYNLTAPVPIKILVTIDPILHAVLNLSGIIKTTDGPLGNVVKFRNYYETKGGDATVPLYLQLTNTYDQTIVEGSFFSEGFTGEPLKNGSQDQPSGTEQPQVDVTTDPAFANKSVKRFWDESANNDVFLGVLKGSGVQHDTMPFYIYNQVLSDFQNS